MSLLLLLVKKNWVVKTMILLAWAANHVMPPNPINITEFGSKHTEVELQFKFAISVSGKIVRKITEMMCQIISQ